MSAGDRHFPCPVMNTESSPMPPVIFQSKPDRRAGWRLAMFVGVALVGHALVFYLFKVVTPAPTRQLPPEESVLVLNGDNPATATVLASLEDRSPASMLVTLGSGSEVNLPRLPLPSYTPSFENYRPPLTFEWEAPPPPLPVLAEASRPVLPRLEKNPPAPRPPVPVIATGATPRLVLSTSLEARGLLQAPRWPAKLSPPEETDEPYFYRLAIDASGKVRYHLIDGMAPPQMITDVITKLRFVSQPGTELLWGELEVHW